MWVSLISLACFHTGCCLPNRLYIEFFSHFASLTHVYSTQLCSYLLTKDWIGTRLTTQHMFTPMLNHLSQWKCRHSGVTRQGGRNWRQNERDVREMEAQEDKNWKLLSNKATKKSVIDILPHLGSLTTHPATLLGTVINIDIVIKQLPGNEGGEGGPRRDIRPARHVFCVRAAAAKHQQ